MLGAAVSGVEEVWLACHGYGQLASRFIRRFGDIADGKRLIVAPEALSRFYLSDSAGAHSSDDKVGASWMTREGRDAEIADQVTYLDLVCKRVFTDLAPSSPRLVAFGFSQGAATVCRWAAATGRTPDHLVLWGAGIPGDVLAENKKPVLARMTITIVAGLSDPVIGGGRVEAHARELKAAGLTYRLVTYDGGHEIDPGTLREIAADLTGSVGTIQS